MSEDLRSQIRSKAKPEISNRWQPLGLDTRARETKTGGGRSQSLRARAEPERACPEEWGPLRRPSPGWTQRAWRDRGFSFLLPVSGQCLQLAYSSYKTPGVGSWSVAPAGSVPSSMEKSPGRMGTGLEGNHAQDQPT